MTSDSADRAWLEAVVIEPMRPDHLAAVLDIERASFPSAWSLDSYLRELRNPHSRYFVAHVAGQVIGYVGMWVIADETHVSTIAVRADKRRCGLGERLMHHLIGVARECQATHITLEVRESNLAAQALYRKLGFQTTAIRLRYYGDTGEDGLVMRKDISPAGSAG